MKDLDDATRSQWGIASIRWQLDVSFREDAYRIRVNDRAEASSRGSLNLLQQKREFGRIQRKPITNVDNILLVRCDTWSV